MPWTLYLFFLVLCKGVAPREKAAPPPPRARPELHAAEPESTPSATRPPPGQMTMYSVYAGDDNQESELTIRCRSERALSNAEAQTLVVGTILEDVVGSNGKMLVPAGSKVVGRAYCDAERSRFLGRGRWTLFAGDHQISARGVLLDRQLREGMSGTEACDGVSSLQVKAAVYRDGIFLHAPAGTEFVLRLQGDVSIQESGSALER